MIHRIGLWRIGFLALAIASTPSRPARADTVELTNGRSLENVAVEDAGAEIAVMRPGMRILIPRSEVIAVRKSETPEQKLARLIEEANGDPERLAAAARFARQSGADDRAREIEEMLVDARLERMLLGVDRRDAEALYAVAARAIEQKIPLAGVQRVLRLVLLADPEHERAHRALGETLFEGRWLPDDEVERRRAERYADEMRAKGFVYYEGTWISPEAKRFEEARRALAEELAAARRLRRELDDALFAAREAEARIARREQELARREAELSERARRLADSEEALESWERRVRIGSSYSLYPYPYCGGGIVIVRRSRCDPPPVPRPPLQRSAVRPTSQLGPLELLKRPPGR